MSRIRVLVIDDSAFARKVLREVLAEDPEIEILDYARDGLEGLEKIATLRPDVVTLDLVMPNLDGLGVLRALPPDGGPRVVVVSVTDENSALGLAALEEGAVDLVHKPTAQATDRLYQLGKELRAKVRTAARARPRQNLPIAPGPAPRPAPVVATRLIAVGASTGGPPALMRLLGALPADLPCPMGVVVHLPVEYTSAFARRLDQVSPLRVREAEDGAVLRPGDVAVGRGGLHLRFARCAEEMVLRLDGGPAQAAHRPSVDVLLESAADAVGAGALAVVLTGMGEDGLIGARAVKAAGGRVLAEAATSCVVDGMPRAIREAGLADGVAPIEEMARLILERL